MDWSIAARSLSSRDLRRSAGDKIVPCDSGEGFDVRGAVATDPGVDKVDAETVLDDDEGLRGVDDAVEEVDG